MDGGINSIFRATGNEFSTLDTNAANAAGASFVDTTKNTDAGKSTGAIFKAFFNTETPQSSLTYNQWFLY